MKILITGGTGFVGQNITDALSRTYGEHNVVALGKKDCDLTSSYGFAKIMEEHHPSVVVHAAGFVGGISHNANNPGRMLKENLVMGINAVEQALTHRSKLIMLGTVCAYPKFTPKALLQNGNV